MPPAYVPGLQGALFQPSHSARLRPQPPALPLGPPLPQALCPSGRAPGSSSPAHVQALSSSGIPGAEEPASFWMRPCEQAPQEAPCWLRSTAAAPEAWSARAVRPRPADGGQQTDAGKPEALLPGPASPTWHGGGRPRRPRACWRRQSGPLLRPRGPAPTAGRPEAASPEGG